jgi:putative aldouronate transport system substrate-binding protein
MTRKLLAMSAMVTVLFLGLALNSYAAGAGQKQDTQQGLVTLRGSYNSHGRTGVLENHHMAQILREDLGIILEYTPKTTDGFLTALAARNLTDDIAQIPDAQMLDSMIQAGMIVSLDDHQANLPNVYANIPSAVQYFRDYQSAGTGKLYALPVGPSNRSQQYGNLNFGPYLRWDYYKELGMPVLNEVEDYLPLLKRMVDAHPLNDEGQTVYGFSLFPEWDGTYMHLAAEIAVLYGKSSKGLLEIDNQTNTTVSILDNSSYYKRALQLFFNANQMGLVDPDSLSQDYPDYNAKAGAGRVMFNFWSWGFEGFVTAARNEAGIGFRLVPFTNEKMYSGAGPSYIGASASFAVISKNTKYLDKALALLDYSYSHDGVWNIYNGRRGVKWDLDENGEPYLTELGWQIQQGTASWPAGGVQGETLAYLAMQTIDPRAIHPVYKRQIDTLDWVKKSFIPADPLLTRDWREKMGARDDIDYLYSRNMAVEPSLAPMETPPENIQILENRVGDVVKTLSWQMVFARNQAEFDRLFAQMVEQAKGIGVETVQRWYADAYAKAIMAGAKYMK